MRSKRTIAVAAVALSGAPPAAGCGGSSSPSTSSSGGSRARPWPIELPTLTSGGTVDETALNRLPPAPSGTLTFPSNDQYTKAENLVAQEWSKEVLG